MKGRTQSGALMWFMWGTLMGFGLLGIFSIGIPILVVGFVLLIPIIRDQRHGAWMALAGAALPWLVFAVEGYVSPDCADGITTISPSGQETFTCRSMHSPSEFMPFLVASLAVFVFGLVLFRVSLSRRSAKADPHR
jgi:hypothetical protein